MREVALATALELEHAHRIGALEHLVDAWIVRFELERLYRGLYRTDGGTTIPVAPLRKRSGYVGCFLAAPYKAP